MPNEESYLNESLRKDSKRRWHRLHRHRNRHVLRLSRHDDRCKILRTNNFGLISLASAVATIASTVILVGMPEGVVRYASFYKGRRDCSVLCPELGVASQGEMTYSFYKGNHKNILYRKKDLKGQSFYVPQEESNTTLKKGEEKQI